MPYIGRELDRGNYLKLDDISSSFDGSTTTFNLTNGGNAFYPGSAFSILVVLAGVVQEPEAAYQINQTQITFASAPLAGDQFFCIVLGQALGVNTPANGSVNGTQLAKPFNYDNYFYLDDANNRVGVGTATPMTPLHVEGTGRFTNVTVTGDLTVDGTTTTLDTVVTEVDKLEVAANNTTVAVAVTQSGSGDILNLYDGTTSVFTVADGGKVGLGVVNPNTKLHIKGPNAPGIRLQDEDGTNQYATFIENNGQFFINSRDDTSRGSFVFRGENDTDTVEFLRIKSDGTVGIGTNNPISSSKLHLYSSDGDSDLTITSASTSAVDINLGDADDIDAGRVRYNNTNNTLSFRTNGDDRVYIKNDGDVGIGSALPQAQFEVYGTSPIVRSKHNASQKYTQINHDGTDGYVDWSSGDLILRGASNAERLRITSAGDMRLGTGTPTSFGPTFQVAGTDPALLLQDTATAVDYFGVNVTSGIAQLWYDDAAAFTINTASGISGAGLSEKVRITSSGNVGIGTNSIAHRFHVYGANTIAKFQSSTSYVDLKFQNTGATNGFIQYNNAGNFRFFASSGSTPTLTIEGGSPGNVGIGEESPDVRLHVKEQFDVAYSLANVANEANHLLKLENPSTTANAFSGMQFRVGSGADMFFGAIQQSVNHGDFFFANQNSPNTELMRIKSSGEVGIGTDNPSARLDVVADAASGYIAEFRQAHASNTAQIIIDSPTDGASRPSYMDYATGGTVKWRTGLAYLDANRSFHIGTGSIPANSKLTIKPDGDVGIGTDNPDTKLHVFNSPTTGQVKIGGGNGAGNHRVYINCSETNSYIDSYGNNGYRKLRINAAPLILNDSGGGSVGIGITNPQAQLHVDGTIHQTSIEYPTIRPVLDLNFATNKFLDDRITFRRDSIATYYGADGLLKYASINEPRFNYDPDTGESLGLLIEDPGTNLISGSGGYGSDIRNGTNLGNTLTSSVVDGVTLPDGTVGQVRRLQAHPSGNSGMRWGSASGGNANTPYSASVWARATSGTATAVIDVNDLGNISYNLTEEWVRMKVTGTRSDPYRFMDIMGSASADFYLWGFQLENNGLVTSYMPVESHMSNNTRANDVAYITGENFTDFYNQSEGTLVLSADIAYLATSNQAAVVFEDTSSESTDLIAVGYRVGGGSSGNLGSWYQGNGSQVAYFNHNAGVTANTEFRQAFAYKKDNLASSVNGGTPQTDNSGTLSTSIDRVKFGGYYADTMKSGHIRYFKYFNKRLSNAQLQGLTTQ